MVDRGCAIYDNRPLPCQLYQCLWLMGKGEKSDRPDHLKIVMDGLTFQIGDRQIGVICFHELEVGAIEQPRIKQIIEAVKQQDFGVHLHRLSPDGAYSVQFSMRSDFMTPGELELYRQAVKARAKT
jgi:hypothetical protein